MDLKSTKSAVTSKTYDRNELDASTGNIYESISIMARRAMQINEDIKTELFEKLEEFATPTENLEEIFENKEQIEVSKFYEKLPKPHAIAIEQWLQEKIYFRHTDTDASE
jgi:DNA-directed RNA polymerase subunit K/omega